MLITNNVVHVFILLSSLSVGRALMLRLEENEGNGNPPVNGPGAPALRIAQSVRNARLIISPMQ